MSERSDTWDAIKQKEQEAENALQTKKKDIEKQKKDLEISLNDREKVLRKKAISLEEALKSKSGERASKKIKTIDIEVSKKINQIEGEFKDRIGKAADKIVEGFGQWQ